MTAPPPVPKQGAPPTPPGSAARFWDRLACVLAAVAVLALALLVSGLFVRASVEDRLLSRAPIPVAVVLALVALAVTLPLSVYAFVLGRRHARNAKGRDARGPDS